MQSAASQPTAATVVTRSATAAAGGVAGAGVWCGCWRGFLLQDVGVVELMGVALRELVPAPPLLPPLGGSTEGRDQVVVGVADACVLLAAAFPEEVARAAGALVIKRVGCCCCCPFPQRWKRRQLRPAQPQPRKQQQQRRHSDECKCMRKRLSYGVVPVWVSTPRTARVPAW